MRQVKILAWKQNQEDKRKFDKVWDGDIGIFHQFGSSYEEFESGPGTFTTAIIEMPDGTIKSVDAELIQFVTPLRLE